MNFYHILYGLKTNGFNRNLTWYENLFVKFYNSAFGQLLAKFLKIKGNTLVFNQLVQNGNFADTSNWVMADATISVSSNVATIKATNTFGRLTQSVQRLNNHVYYAKAEVKLSTASTQVKAIQLNTGNGWRTVDAINDTNWHVYETVWTQTGDNSTADYFRFAVDERTSDRTDNFVRNVMLIDLTKLNNSAITDATSFRTYFSLPYYAYNTGSLLSFNGTGIKTVGFNQWDEEWELGYYSTTTGEKASSNTNIRSKNYIKVLPNTTYFYKSSSSSGQDQLLFYDANSNFVSTVATARNTTFLTPLNAQYMTFFCGGSYGATYNNDICINISDTSKNGTYEPYTTSTLSLPISTYFPTGMKSAGSGSNLVFDELTKNKATQRVGTRAYESGDESDATVTTDGTNTNYALAEPVETTIDPPLDLSYLIEWGGTEQLLPENTSTPTTSPIKADMRYPSPLGSMEDEFTYKAILKPVQRMNMALSIIMGRSITVPNPEEPLNILLKGE